MSDIEWQNAEIIVAMETLLQEVAPNSNSLSYQIDEIIQRFNIPQWMIEWHRNNEGRVIANPTHANNAEPPTLNTVNGSVSAALLAVTHSTTPRRKTDTMQDKINRYREYLRNNSSPF